MTRTITASYRSKDAALNALDELVADGLDREKVFFDAAKTQLKVMIPDSAAPEITEILDRHNPTEIH